VGELTGNADRCRHGNMGGQERRREEKRTWDGQLKLGEMAGRRGVSCHL